jgi:hypothetical protein
MLNIARNAQAFQQAQQLNPLALQQAQSQADLSQTQATKARLTLDPEVQQAQSLAAKAKVELSDAELANLQKHQANSSRNLIKILDSTEPVTPERIKDHVIQTMTNAGAPDKAIIQAIQNLPKSGTDKELRAYLAKHTLNSLTAEAELERRYPNAQMLNTGQEAVPVTMGNPSLAMQPPGTQVGLPIQMQLPPSTATVSQTGQPGYLGAQKTPGFVPSALPPNAGLGTEDIQKTFSDAQTAQNRIGLLQNIKDLAGKSFTGVGGSRKEFVTGLANAIGVPAFELEKANTDVLAKNSALLSLAGGNTDMARALAEAANPNKKMNLEAIKEASNQLIASERLKQKKAEFLKPFVNDPIALQNKQLEFAKVADPRLLQEMTPEQVKSLKQSMTPDERKEFAEKLAEARRLGLVK